MASVAEVQAAIAAANVLIAEAQDAVTQTVNSKLTEALVQLDWIRETSIDPLGAPQVRAAIELTEQLGQLCSIAIETNATYAGSM